MRLFRRRRLRPAALAGLLLGLAGCAGGSPSGPTTSLQLTSALDYRPLDKAALEDPYVSMRVQLCDAIGGTHCRELKMPVDELATLPGPDAAPALVFVTIRGLGPSLPIAFSLDVSGPAGTSPWQDRWAERTTDDFAPRLPFYESRTIPSAVFSQPGAYKITVSTDRSPAASATLSVGTQSPPAPAAATLAD